MRALFPAIILSLLLFAGLTVASDFPDRCRVPDHETTAAVTPLEPAETPQPTVSGESKRIPDFQGTLRIYMVEPESRWNDYNFFPYVNGFLDFAYNQIVTIPYEDSITITRTWNASAAGYGNITEGNIAAVAAIANTDNHTNYSDPPSGAPFTAHYVDACAFAAAGETGADTAFGNYTHTVLVEEGTATT